MVKNNESKVEITTRNIKYYTDKGYKCNVGGIISINVNTMPKNSHNKVIAICEKCGRENEISFSKYNKNKNNQGYYCCRGCSEIKKKITMVDKYGVENYKQLESEKEKMKIWMSSDEFKNKSKETMIEIYGFDHYSKTEDYRDNQSILMRKMVKKKKEEGTYDCPFTWENNKELREEGMLKTYGAKYSFQIPEIKKKIQDKNLERFGHISPFGNEEIRRKIKEKIIYKYKNDVSKYIDEIYNTNEFRVYRRKVRYNTDIIRGEFLKNWDGYDYYDNEYIKDYFILNKNDRKYPSIDHKISCFYGFINDIDPNDISAINNLCVTKRSINSRKRELLEKEFKIYLIQNKLT